MRKIVSRSILLITAIAVILLVVLNRRSPFGRNNSDFAVGDEHEITGIELSQDDSVLSLVKEDGDWLVNGKEKARESSMHMMERVLRGLSIKSPVSAGLYDSVVVRDAIEPVRVRVFEKRKLLKSFLVYKTQTNLYGNIMKVREASKPFIVYLPAYEGDIGSLFSLNDLYWQPYLIFNLLPSEITFIDFKNYSDTTSSFMIINNDDRLYLATDNTPLHGWDSSLVRRYISYFTRIPFEEWALFPGDEESHKIESGTPLYSITVGTSEEKEIVLTLWEKMLRGDNILIPDSDRLYGKTDKSDQLFILRYFDIDPVIKRRGYFFHE